MMARVMTFSAGAEYLFTQEGCFINELSNTAQDPEVSIARVRVEPGVTTRLHRLDGITERYVMLEGQGEVELDGADRIRVGPGDVVVIPPGCSQRMSNHNDNELVFLAICSPRFVPSRYISLERA